MAPSPQPVPHQEKSAARPRARWWPAVVAVAAALGLAAVGVGMVAANPTSREPVAIAPGLYGIEAGRVWAYGASSRDGVLLFDAGSDPEGRALGRLLAAMGAGRERVTHVFLTHGHSNHVAGAAGFPRARVWGGGADGDLFAGRRRPLEPLQFVQSWFRSPPVITITDPLEERTAVDVGGAEVLAIPVPGHTAGSFAYLYARTLFAGDVLHVDGGRFVHTTRFVGRDEEGTERSMLALVEAARGLAFDRICTGHGGCTPAGDARALLQAFVGR